MTNYLLRIALTNFLGSRVMEVEDQEGMMQKGVFIPFDMNGLHETERGNVSAYFFVTERMTASVDGSSHFVKMKMKKEALDKINELGYQTPYVGDMRPSTFKPMYQIDYLNSGGRVKQSDYFNDKKEIDYGEL